MRFKPPKNTDRISWTKHAIRKMQYYQLSETRLKRVLNNPKRKELGIAPGTVAVMQPASTRSRSSTRGGPAKKEWNSEIWLMYQNLKEGKLRIITAWRYPGKSPIRGPIPIPEEILEELGEQIYVKTSNEN